MDYVLEFEKPLQVLENQIKELQESSVRPGLDLSAEIEVLQKKVNRLIKEIYSNLSAWERVQLSRHPSRPHAIDYIQGVFDHFCELSGDRSLGNDEAMVTGLAYLNNQKVAVIGIEKGRRTQDKIKRNFGMASPDGYRKALRVMKLAEQFRIPVVTLVDTPGAYPGIEAEQRGQAYSIAQNLEEMALLETPLISIVIGEGGSGGALGLALADRVAMLEYSIYSVISPESCASILWSDPKKAQDAANALQLTADKALELKVIDEILAEPIGGAHRNYQESFSILKQYLDENLKKLSKVKLEKLVDNRQKKFRAMGNHFINEK